MTEDRVKTIVLEQLILTEKIRVKTLKKINSDTGGDPYIGDPYIVSQIRCAELMEAALYEELRKHVRNSF